METLNADKLVCAHREIETPFKLVLDRDGIQTDLIFRQVLRLLPGKRIVAHAECDGDQVLVKTYLGRAAARYAARERSGVAAIAGANVTTPELLWSGKLAHGQGEVLAFRYIGDAKSLYQRWEEAENEAEKIDTLSRAILVIGKLHNHGVVQQDLHLANFILSGNQLYTIDGGEVQKRSTSPLSQEDGIKNLGLFFAQFYPKYDHLARAVLPQYEAARGWSTNSGRADQLEMEIGRCREARKRSYIHKVFRDCTRFVCESSFRRFQVCERRALSGEVAALLEDPEKWITRGTVLKDGNSTTVVLVPLSDRSLVIKRYNVKNFWHGVRRAFRKSRAWNSWSNVHRMEFFGIPTLKPIAMIENRIGPLRTGAYFITEFIEGPNAQTCLRNMKNPDSEVEALASILFDLSRAQISHGDLKATNFLMAEHGPIIIDLDAMREHKKREHFERAFGKDLDRFFRNWDDRPDLMDRFDRLLEELPGCKRP